jgi:hypothetical protein
VFATGWNVLTPTRSIPRRQPNRIEVNAGPPDEPVPPERYRAAFAEFRFNPARQMIEQDTINALLRRAGFRFVPLFRTISSVG